MTPVDDDGRPLGWPMEPLLAAALPGVKPGKRTVELVAFALAEADLFAVEAALVRGWCTDAEADRWAVSGVGLFPWRVWGGAWLDEGLAPLDRLHPLDEWWRPAWLWAEEVATVATSTRDVATPGEAAA